MIDVKEAISILSKHPFPFTAESIPLNQAIGRVLMESLKADRDFPPFNRVSMDGIAINYGAWAAGQRSFPIVETVAAGSPQYILRSAGDCVEIMTGAILPENTDTIVRYEDLSIKEGVAEILISQLEKGKNVHKQATDRKQNDLIVSAPRIIGPAELGIAATIGKSTLRVTKMPKTIVISTGDELIPVDQTPLDHQIRSSNTYTIISALKDLSIDADVDHFPDEEQVVEDKLASHLKTYRIVVIIGGSSKGKYDYIPAALEKLGVEKKFYRVKQRPGKPFWFGVKDAKQFVFALPGNPASCFMCTERYIKDWLRLSLGVQKNWRRAQLMEDFQFIPDLTYYLQVKLRYDGGRILAFPVAGGGSGDLANLAEADGFLELPRGRQLFKAGEVFPLLQYRNI